MTAWLACCSGEEGNVKERGMCAMWVNGRREDKASGSTRDTKRHVDSLESTTALSVPQTKTSMTFPTTPFANFLYSRAAAPVPICESSSNTCAFSAVSRACSFSGSVQLSRSGSPVCGSDWMRSAPRGTSRITRRRPCEKGPPERRIETPTISWWVSGWRW